MANGKGRGKHDDPVRATNEELHGIQRELMESGDRATGIVGAAALDAMLEHVITLYLQISARLRNNFAHRWRERSFAEQDIADACFKLTFAKRRADTLEQFGWAQTLRDWFIGTTIGLYIILVLRTGNALQGRRLRPVLEEIEAKRLMSTDVSRRNLSVVGGRSKCS